MTIKHVKYNGAMDTVLHCSTDKRGKVVIPDSVYKIAEEAFIDCKYITAIEFPDSLAYIDESAFKDCSGLVKITLRKL